MVFLAKISKLQIVFPFKNIELMQAFLKLKFIRLDTIRYITLKKKIILGFIKHILSLPWKKMNKNNKKCIIFMQEKNHPKPGGKQVKR